MGRAHESWTVLPHGPVEVLAANLRRVEGSLPDMPLGRVMTIARRRDGRLVIHNAIALEEPLMRELEAWGEPAFLVVPSAWHRLDAFVFAQRYPGLTVLCPAGARRAVQKVVPVGGTCDDLPPDDDVSLRHLDGLARREGVLTVRSEDGATLVLNDAIFNLPHLPGLFGLVYRWTGSTGGPRVTRIFRWFVVKDRTAFRMDLERLADIPDLRRVIVSHGAMIASGVRDTLRQAAATI